MAKMHINMESADPRGLRFERILSKKAGAYADIEWEYRTAEIINDKGEKIFFLENVEVPSFWSELATNVVASKYFRRAGTGGEQETSVRQIIDRVVDTITKWGDEQGYFATKDDEKIFSDELKFIIVNQMAIFNSPVWFNVGIDENPVVSACFLNSVEDTMESIMELATTEAMLFKGGSGSGTNLSTLRSSKEKLSSGGNASGPVSFMRGYDAFAGVVKSGGRTRRSACLRALNVNHPDILEFIDCKVGEEKKAWALIDAGYDGGLNGEAYSTVAFQNANNTVRVSDEFMRAVVYDREYSTLAVQTGEPIETLKARNVLKRIAEATHFCGDPGLQFDDTINRWNTCAYSGRINTSNPCFSGEMRLLTVDGYRTFRELARQGEVSLINYKGEVSKGFVRSSGVKEVVKISFDLSPLIRPIICTPDHLFMLADGTTKKAKDLSPVDRLKRYSLKADNLVIRQVPCVESVTPYGKVEVFDFSEPKTNWGIVENVVAHNCSEAVFLDDSACNLASLNLMKFFCDDGTFNTKTFRHVVDIMLTAQDIMVDKGHYPTETIRRNSSAFRPLGLGFANLGALLMSLGLPYDSHMARTLASAISGLMTGEAYAQSARMATVLGPFAEYDKNAKSMGFVVDEHDYELANIDWAQVPAELERAVKKSWYDAQTIGGHRGYRNAQVTAIAPTGTIAMAMSCDSTGIEPDLWLVKTKQLSGGGSFRIVNQSVKKALTRLGYDDNDSRTIIDHINKTGAAAGAAALKKEHLPVFDCALGARAISPKGHLKMMAAVQPFISGAISKTVNVGHDTTVDEIFDIYVDAWKMGLKSVTVYRDGSKRTQPLSTGQKKESKHEAASPLKRRKLPDERASLTHKFDIAGHKGYITAGMYDDGSLGEIFITMSKQGSVVAGMMDSFASAISIALQYGVPLEVFVRKYMHTHFEPSGVTRNPEIPIAKSITDYLFRWLQSRFCSSAATEEPHQEDDAPIDSGTPPCPECGSFMVPAGACHRCLNCGGSSGCE